MGKFLPPDTILLLKGDLGAGKTTLVQGIGGGLGITDAIVSPTFTVEWQGENAIALEKILENFI